MNSRRAYFLYVVPAPAVGDRGQLLHVHVDEFARPVALADHRLGRPVLSVEAAHAVRHEDPLDRGGGQPGLVGDVGGSPASRASQHEDLGPLLRGVAHGQDLGFEVRS